MPPATSPRSRASIVIWVLALAALVVLLLPAAVWILRVVVTGGSTVETLESGDSVSVADSGFTVTLPDGWSGQSEEFVLAPSWAGGAPLAPGADGLRQAIMLESPEYAFRFLVFADEAEWSEAHGVWGRSTVPTGAGGTAFDRPAWTARSNQSTETPLVVLFRRADSDEDAMLVGLFTKTGETTVDLATQLNELVAD
jgi:hypothetical protein